MSLFAENLSEQEEKIAALERANFDLKMQVFYLNKKIADGGGAVDDGQNAVNINVIEDRSAEIMSLKEELVVARHRIEELQSELLQLQLIRDNEAIEYQKLLHNQPSSDITLLEDSRRREREIAKTIAEHDAALIAQLRQEADSLQVQHERDVKLVEDCTARLAKQMEVFEVTSAELGRIREENQELLNKVTVLTDTARRQEQLLAEAQATNNRIDPQLHDLLRRENAQLKEQVERQKVSIANQAEALSKLGVSSSQESQELIRLATELDVCCTARDEALLAQQKLKYENDVLRTQLYELKSIHAIGQPELSPASFQKTLLGSASLVDAKVVDAYKKRETELLTALEGVIQRCRELEEEQHLQSLQGQSEAQRQCGGPSGDWSAAIAPHGGGSGAAYGQASAAMAYATGVLQNHAGTPGGTRVTPGHEATTSRGRTSQPSMDAGRASRSKSAERRKKAWH